MTGSYPASTAALTECVTFPISYVTHSVFKSSGAGYGVLVGGGDGDLKVDGSVDGTSGHSTILYIFLAQLDRALIYSGDVGANPTEDLWVGYLLLQHIQQYPIPIKSPNPSTTNTNPPTTSISNNQYLNPTYDPTAP